MLQAVQLRDTIIEKLYQELSSLSEKMRDHMATHQEVINSSKEVKKERDRLKKGFELQSNKLTIYEHLVGRL